MHPSMVFPIVVAIIGTAVVHGHPAADTPSARFWEQALPGTPMPEAIADLVQKGIDQWPLLEHYSALPSISVCALLYTICPTNVVERTGLFFNQAQLRSGNTMTISLPAEAEPAILPHDVADKVPFENLGDVLATFGIPPGSVEADQVADTLRSCQAPPHIGEQKSCTTSLESTVQTAMDMLSTTSTGMLAVTSVLPADGLPDQPYKVRAVTPLHDGAGYLACHKMPFPYAVYQCHRSSSGRGYYGAYFVSLHGLREEVEATMLAICHDDTSNWNPAHPAFEILHTQPGGKPVCHFIPSGNLVFIKKIAKV
ncbi:hypothetical protein ACP4OV_029093 [Aristida adscensionis]